MVLIMVSALAAGAQGAISLPLNDNLAVFNVPLPDSLVVAIVIQNNDGSFSIMYLEQADAGQQRTPVRGDTIQLFPNATTIVGLGLAGLQLRRRKPYTSTIIHRQPKEKDCETEKRVYESW